MMPPEWRQENTQRIVQQCGRLGEALAAIDAVTLIATAVVPVQDPKNLINQHGSNLAVKPSKGVECRNSSVFEKDYQIQNRVPRSVKQTWKYCKLFWLVEKRLMCSKLEPQEHCCGSTVVIVSGEYHVICRLHRQAFF